MLIVHYFRWGYSLVASAGSARVADMADRILRIYVKSETRSRDPATEIHVLTRRCQVGTDPLIEPTYSFNGRPLHRHEAPGQVLAPYQLQMILRRFHNVFLADDTSGNKRACYTADVRVRKDGNRTRYCPSGQCHVIVKEQQDLPFAHSGSEVACRRKVGRW